MSNYVMDKGEKYEKSIIGQTATPKYSSLFGYSWYNVAHAYRQDRYTTNISAITVNAVANVRTDDGRYITMITYNPNNAEWFDVNDFVIGGGK